MPARFSPLARLLGTLLLLSFLLSIAFLPVLLHYAKQPQVVISPSPSVAYQSPLTAKQERANDQLLSLWSTDKGDYESANAKSLTLQAVQVALAQGADVDVKDSEGQTTLIWAARYDNLPLVRFLLAHGANANAISSNRGYIGATALVTAAAFKDLPMAQALLEAHADPNINADGYNALSLAAENDQPELAELLLSHGANVEIHNQYDDPPLITGAHFTDMIRMLLAHGTKVDSTSSHGETALMATATPLLGKSTPSSKSVECLRLLLAAGANVNATAADGRTALISAAEAEDVPAATFLLDHGASLSASIQGDSPPDGTALDLAASGTYGESLRIIAMLRLLLDRGADPNETARSGWPALMSRAKHGDLSSVQLLLDRGADVNAKGAVDANPLSEAVKAGQVAVVQFLLKHGAILSPDSNRETALIKAASSGSIPLMKMFLAAGQKINDQDKYGETPLTWAISSNHPEAVKFLLAHGANIHVQVQGQTPLIEALNVSMEPDSLVALLLQYHPDVNLKDGSGTTALMMAARSNKVKITQGLLTSGANINLKANDGQTALMEAVDLQASTFKAESNQVQNPKIVMLLIAHGAEVNARDNTDRTALMISAGWGDTTVVKLLLAHGAKINLRDKQGETALSLAATNVRPEMVKLLKSAGAE